MAMLTTTMTTMASAVSKYKCDWSLGEGESDAKTSKQSCHAPPFMMAKRMERVQSSHERQKRQITQHHFTLGLYSTRLASAAHPRTLGGTRTRTHLAYTWFPPSRWKCFKRKFLTVEKQKLTLRTLVVVPQSQEDGKNAKDLDTKGEMDSTLCKRHYITRLWNESMWGGDGCCTDTDTDTNAYTNILYLRQSLSIGGLLMWKLPRLYKMLAYWWNCKMHAGLILDCSHFWGYYI